MKAAAGVRCTLLLFAFLAIACPLQYNETNEEKVVIDMRQERLETVCARLCLLSSLDRMPEDPAPITRRAAKLLFERRLLDGLVLRESETISPELLDRARRLLARASSVYKSILHYQDIGYQVILPEDDRWPKKLFCLCNAMPQYLFVRGNISLLEENIIAVAGSREICSQTQITADRIGCAIATAGLTLVCGGARGVDRAALHGTLLHGGKAIVVPAVPAYQILKDTVCLDALQAGNLLILCETPPDEAFSSSKALARNHTIYALASCSLVVASRKNKGGSFAGARDCLKGQWTPVYVLNEPGTDFEGNAILKDLGAHGTSILEIESGDLMLCRGSTMQSREINTEYQTSLFTEDE